MNDRPQYKSPTDLFRTDAPEQKRSGCEGQDHLVKGSEGSHSGNSIGTGTHLKLLRSRDLYDPRTADIGPSYGLGVVLSGGGVKGVSHVAFLQRLCELGHTPDIISGSSAGALVGALHASGMSGEGIIDFFRATPLFRMSWVSMRLPGIFNTEKYQDLLQTILPPRFEDLKIPLVIAAVNAEAGEVEYFSSGDLYRPLLASCAVPLLYSPVAIHGQWYFDGGVVDNFPVGPLLGKTRHLLGSYACKPSIKDKNELNSGWKLTNHASALLVHAANRHKISQTDFTMQFQLDEFSSFNNRHLDVLYQKARAEVEATIHMEWLPSPGDPSHQCA